LADIDRIDSFYVARVAGFEYRQQRACVNGLTHLESGHPNNPSPDSAKRRSASPSLACAFPVAGTTMSAPSCRNGKPDRARP